jgi:hypothetical protein
MLTQESAVTARDASWRVRLVRLIRNFGSYAGIVLLLPGGSLFALSFWMFRHRTWLAARMRRVLSAVLAFGVGLIFPR